MPVVFDNNFSASTNGAKLVLNFTLGASASLVVFGSGVSSNFLGKVIYNGVACTNYGAVGASGRTSVWVLSAPAAGNNVLSISFNAASTFAVVGVSYINTKQVGGFGTFVSATATAVTNMNISASSTTTDIVVAMYRIGSNATITLNNGTLRGSATSGASLRIVVADIAGAQPVTLSAQVAAATSWECVGVPLIFSVGTSTVLKFQRLQLGVGY